MLEWIADYRVLGALEDPARPGVRVTAAPPARLGLTDDRVVVELVDGDPGSLLPWLAGWADAAGRGPGLAVPLEVGPVAGGSFVARSTPGVDGPGAAPTIAAVTAAAGGLATLHASTLVHGALTPARILSTGDGSGGVLDLPAVDPAGSALVTVAPSADALDTVAPEVLRGDPPAPSSDVWSLGCCLLRAVTGAPAHPGIDQDVLLAAVARVTGERPAVEGAVQQYVGLVSACLQLDPDARPPAADVVAALRTQTLGAG